MHPEGYWRDRIATILDHHYASREQKIDAIWKLLVEANVLGRKDLASELRNLLQVKEDRDEPWPE